MHGHGVGIEASRGFRWKSPGNGPFRSSVMDINLVRPARPLFLPGRWQTPVSTQVKPAAKAGHAVDPQHLARLAAVGPGGAALVPVHPGGIVLSRKHSRPIVG